jgi:hypothetical protein
VTAYRHAKERVVRDRGSLCLEDVTPETNEALDSGQPWPGNVHRSDTVGVSDVDSISEAPAGQAGHRRA